MAAARAAAARASRPSRPGSCVHQGIQNTFNQSFRLREWPQARAQASQRTWAPEAGGSGSAAVATNSRRRAGAPIIVGTICAASKPCPQAGSSWCRLTRDQSPATHLKRAAHCLTSDRGRKHTKTPIWTAARPLPTHELALHEQPGSAVFLDQQFDVRAFIPSVISRTAQNLSGRSPSSARSPASLVQALVCAGFSHPARGSVSSMLRCRLPHSTSALMAWHVHTTLQCAPHRSALCLSANAGGVQFHLPCISSALQKPG